MYSHVYTYKDSLPHIYKDSKSGKLKLNFKKLKNLVESCGFPFIKRKGFPLTPEFTRMDESVVFYLSSADCTFFEELYPDYFPIRIPTEWSPHLGALFRFGNGLLVIDEIATKQHICHWLNDCEDCLICFDKTILTQDLKNTNIGCFCGATLCFGCFIDMLLSSEPQMKLVCPNCRRYSGPIQNFGAIFQLLAFGRESIKSMKVEQIDFLESKLGFDLDSHWPVRGSPEYMHLEPLIDSILKKLKVDSSTVVEEIAQLKKLKEMLCLRRTKKGGASAGGSSAVAVSNGGCANCGKAFWDKSEWKRAPKCPKCKRTAYCSAKCRKSHRKVHATLCSPKATKQTLKANGKRKRRCAP